jgi:fluoride exporter
MAGAREARAGFRFARLDMTIFWVALGGAVGSVARYGCAALAVRLAGPSFPWGTLFVNVSGSFVIGVLAALLTSDGRPLVTGDARAFLMVGVLGGFTTFSSFSADTLNLARAGEWAAAGANVGASMVLCIAAVWLGYAGATALNR